MGNSSDINLKDLDLPDDFSSGIHMDTLYIFGIDQSTKKQTIIAFDSKEERFYYKKVPDKMKVWNYTAPVYLSEKCILVSGGISSEMNNIVGEMYYYNPEQNKAVKLDDMTQKRYTHMSIFYQNVRS